MSDNLRISDERADFDPEAYARIVIALARYLASAETDQQPPDESDEGTDHAAA